MDTNTDEVLNKQNAENSEVAQMDEAEESPALLPGYDNFDDFLKKAFAAMKCGIKTANSLPSGENFNYYSCFPIFNDVKNKESQKILDLLQGIVKLSGASGNMRHRDVEERFDLLVEANDIFLDRAGICMDEEEGGPKKPEVALVVSQTSRRNAFGSWNTTTAPHVADRSGNTNAASSIRLLAGRNISRPQLSFKDKIDNSYKPWHPRIKDKPNSLKPLALYLVEGENGDVFNNPYEVELDKFEPPEIQLEKSEPESYKSLEDTPLIVIEKLEDMKILLDDLRQYTEIAVDLEHHSYRTYQGITCLMQISTRDTDYLIDTLTLRSELHLLNEIFTKPTILKVFHGADSDIRWLQRDLSLYVVNMFDTYQAAKQLDLPYRSLAYLMKRHCNVDPNKHFQLADWRIRPLPEELMKYAREDTHYLLYIKDILRNALIDQANGQKNIVRAVYERSTEVCKYVYEKPVWNEESYVNMYRKSHKMFNNRQLFALKELHKWRDDTARQEDDSTGYVLPNHMLLNIAETLPREMQGILACCNPIPPLVRQNLLRIHKVILKAREQPLIKPVLEQDIRQRLAQRHQTAASDAWIYAPHDIPTGTEIQPDLPCLLDSPRLENIPAQDTNHQVTVFDGPTGADLEEILGQRRILEQKKTLFVSPFERYKKVMPMVAAQEEEERKRLQENEEMQRVRAAIKEEEGTASSIERVRQHFQNVVQGLTSSPADSSSDSTRMERIVEGPLSERFGRKRKRQSDITETSNYQGENTKYDVSTPRPSEDVTVVQSFVKKRKNEFSDRPNERKTMKYDSPKGPKNNQKFSPKKGKKKPKFDIPPKNDLYKPPVNSKRIGPYSASPTSVMDQRRANREELEKKGMLPQKNFDYKSVDFSSFQGGSSTGDVSKSTNFQQQKQKDKIRKGKKRKKQKINGI